VRTSD